ncbi:MAG TPA: hypothetical protein VF813_06010 [Anaerolineaceae bacterium]
MKLLHRSLALVIALSLLLAACGPAVPASPPAPSGPAQPTSATDNPGAAPTGPAAQGGATAAPVAGPTATGPGGGSQPGSAPLALKIPDPSGTPADAAARLAQSLSQAASADEAAPLLAEILTWAGVTVYNSSGSRINHPLAPLSQLHLFDFQVFGLALDYMNRGGMTVGELAQSLAEAETTIDGAPITGSMLQSVFSAWTTSAQTADPTSWEVFTPLFLRALNLAKSPAVDLQYSGYDDNAVLFTTLELALFASAHVRDDSPAPDSLSQSAPGVQLVSFARQNACAEWNKSQESAFGKWGQEATGWSTGEVLGEAWNLLGHAAGKAAGTTMKMFGKGFGWLLTGITALAGMTAWEFSIRADPNPAHYKHDESGDVNAYFIATVKINEKWPQWFSDCMKSIGKEMPDNRELNKNIIRWVPIYKLPPHATIDTDGLNGRLEEHFSSSGEAKLKLIMDQEKDRAWETAPEKQDHVTVRGELYRDNSLPGAETLIEAASGNIPAAVLPVLMKWYDKWFPKKAYGVMTVTYHKIVPMVFTQEGISGGVQWTATGYNCEGIYGKWTITLSGSGNEQGMNFILDGNLEGTLPKEGDGTFSGKESISVVVSTAPVTGALDMSATGKLRLGGTKDAPVLVLQTDKGTGTASGAGPGLSISMPLSGPGGSPYGVAIRESPEFSKCK